MTGLEKMTGHDSPPLLLRQWCFPAILASNWVWPHVGGLVRRKMGKDGRKMGQHVNFDGGGCHQQATLALAWPREQTYQRAALARLV